MVQLRKHSTQHGHQAKTIEKRGRHLIITETTKQNIRKAIDRIQDSRQAIFLDIDDTLLDPGPKWVKYIEDRLNIKFDLEDVYRSGGFYPHFSTSTYQNEFLDMCKSLIFSKNFYDGLPLLDGAKEGLEALSKNTGTILGGYLTARPDSVYETTRASIIAHGLPVLPIISRPDEVFNLPAEDWKMVILKNLSAQYEGRLVMIDDNHMLSKKTLAFNRGATELKIINILLISDINQALVHKENLYPQPQNGFYITRWEEMQPLFTNGLKSTPE